MRRRRRHTKWSPTGGTRAPHLSCPMLHHFHSLHCRGQNHHVLQHMNNMKTSTMLICAACPLGTTRVCSSLQCTALCSSSLQPGACPLGTPSKGVLKSPEAGGYTGATSGQRHLTIDIIIVIIFIFVTNIIMIIWIWTMQSIVD